jgi:hypothetical protein
LTRLEALRAALSAAVRDGETELAKALTKIAAEEVRVSRIERHIKTSQKLGRFSLSGDRGKSQTRPR